VDLHCTGGAMAAIRKTYVNILQARRHVSNQLVYGFLREPSCPSWLMFLKYPTPASRSS
jgi:hypothetical protein